MEDMSYEKQNLAYLGAKVKLGPSPTTMLKDKLQEAENKGGTTTTSEYRTEKPVIRSGQ